MCVLKDGSRKSSRCKPGDQNFGRVAIAARKRASGVWEEENLSLARVHQSQMLFAATQPREQKREQKKDEKV